MNIVMSYIDYNMAALEEREIFSCNKTAVCEIYERLEKTEGIEGAVIIATCNRTELYLSLKDGEDMNPFLLLCQYLGVDYEKYKHINRTLRGDDAIVHLCKVAAGAESQIWGDHQIISQVRDAIKEAGKVKASDAILNVVFRTAVSAGKKVKTLVDFKVNDNSTADRAVNILKNDPEIKRVLVIGNGMIGRLVAENLAKAGLETTMTLRQYKYGENIVPQGVATVNYSDRNSVIAQVDGVVSATLSPHYTVHYDEIKDFEKLPKVFIDLAVPRDVEPNIGDIEGVTCYNVDDISRDTRDLRQSEQMEQIEKIIEKYMDDFYKWYNYREQAKRG